MEEKEKDIEKALTKKAVGYDVKEVVEEYASDGNALILTKKKVTKKHIPPDTQAAKLVLDAFKEKNSLSLLTAEELKNEKERLLKILLKEKK